MKRSIMDIRNIRENIKNVTRQAFLKLKETLKLPYAKFYILLSVFLTIIFLVFTFPYDVIIRNHLKKMEPATGIGIFVGSIDFSLIGDSYLDELEISLRGGGLVSLRDVNFNVAINPVTTLINKTLKGDFTIHKFSYSENDTLFSGVFNSRFDIAFNPVTGNPSKGILQTDLKNVSLKGLNVKGFDIPAIQFSAIRSDASLTNNELKIKKISLEGDDLRGNIQGTIMLAQLLGNSLLNLSIEIDPQSRIFEKYKILLGNFNKSGEGRIIIPVTGTLQNPSADFPWNGKE